MVLGRRLVAEKSPINSNVSPAATPPDADGSTPLMRISSISSSSAITDAVFVPLRVTTISVSASRPPIPAAQGRRPGVDAVGFRRCVAVYDERVAGRPFGTAIDDVTAIGRRRRIGVPDDGVVAGIAIDRVDAEVAAGIDDEIVNEEIVAVIPVAVRREANGGQGSDLRRRQGDVESAARGRRAPPANVSQLFVLWFQA